MKHLNILVSTLFFAALFFSACDSINEAQVVADEFYEAYNAEDEEKMEALLDKESVIDAGIKDQFYSVFDQHWQAFGKVTSHKQYAFSTNTNNGLTTVLLKFNCETENGSAVYEKLRFVKRSEGYKIFEYEYNIDKAVIDKTEN